jgi:dTMP kinase
LQPALAAGQVVLSDRYADATVAYQGAGRGFPTELITEIVQLATDGLKPDLTLLFDLSVEASLDRTRRRNSNPRGDRLDAEEPAFHKRVRDEYLRIAMTEPDRVKIIDSDGALEDTQARVREIVIPFLESRGYRFKPSDEEQATAGTKRGHC